MKVKYLTGAGRPYGPGIKRGDEVEVDAAEGQRLIKAGLAEAVAAHGLGRRKATSHKTETAEKRAEDTTEAAEAAEE